MKQGEKSKLPILEFDIEGNVVLYDKSMYGKNVINKDGRQYNFIKIAERENNGDFLILIESTRNKNRALVSIERDKDFTVRFN